MTWVAEIANNFVHNGEKEKFYLARHEVIFGNDHILRKNLSIEDKGKFKPVENFLKEEKKSSYTEIRLAKDTFLLTIAIFGINIDRFDTQGKNNVKASNYKWWFMLLAIGLIMLLVLWHVLSPVKPSGQSKPDDFKVELSALLNTPIQFEPNIKSNVELLANEVYGWKKQIGAGTFIDSAVVRLTVRNNTDHHFYPDKLILKTGDRTTLKNPAFENFNTIVNPNLSISLDRNQTDWNYIYKILGEPSFSSIPPFTESDALILIKGDDEWDEEVISFTFSIEGSYQTKTLNLECDKIYSLGFSEVHRFIFK